MTNVSIIMPIYKPDKERLKEIDAAIKEQKFDGDIEIIKVDECMGLAKQMNIGIKKAKYDIIVTLHQDCVPVGEKWLDMLVKSLEESPAYDDLEHIYPFKMNGVPTVACTSDVLDVETGASYTPLLDEKGCAYKRKALEKAGYFDEKTFANSGEDMDLYLKLKKIGNIAYPHSVVQHFHPGYLNPKGEKSIQNANTLGALFRVHGFRLPGWWKGLLKATIFFFQIEYSYWFWRGFFKKRQDWRKGQTLRLLIRNYFT